MSDEEGATLLDLRVVVANWYQRRLRSFFRRTLNQGVGAFLIFALSLTTAAICARLAWIGGLQDQQYVARLMQAKVQPQTEATRGTVLSLLLAGLEDEKLSRELYCNGRKSNACGVGLDLWQRTQQLIDTVDLQASHSPDSDKTAESEIIAQTLGSNDTGVAGTLSLNLLGRRNLASDQPPSIDDEMTNSANCGDLEKNRKLKSTYLLSEPLCTGTGASLTVEIIPEQAADAFGQGVMQARRDQDQSPVDALRIRDFRLRRGHLDSVLFDLVIGSMTLQLHKQYKPGPRESTGPEIAAAYFITADSLIRYWRRTGGTNPEELPSYRLWAARPYFESLLKYVNTTEPVETRAYMDFAGNGIVYTQCHPLSTSSPPTQFRFETHSRAGIGALCVDYSLTDSGMTSLVNVVAQGPVTDAIEIVFSPGAKNPSFAKDAHSLPSWAISDAVRSDLSKVANELNSDPAKRREIIPLGSDTGVLPSAIFLIPSRIDNDGRLTGILMRVAGIGPLGSRPVPMLITIVALAVALGALLAGFTGSREVARRERLLGRLRSLQIAVIQTDGLDRITAANDRAEDLIGRELPAFGLEEAPQPEYWKVFDSDSILLEKEVALGPVPQSPDRLSVEHVDRDTILQQRESGRSSTYYVRLRSPAARESGQSGWRSFARRVRRIDRHEDLLATFGVLETVPTAIVEALVSNLKPRPSPDRA